MEPIDLDFPESFETQRLLLRTPKPGDGLDLHQAVCESFEELRQWMPWAVQKPTLQEAEHNVRRAYIQFLERTDLRLSIYLKEPHILVGSTGLHRCDWNARTFEIGYWGHSKHHRQGYVTEAVKGVCDFAFTTLQAHRLEIRCDPYNLTSKRLAERVHFRLEAELEKNSVTPQGEWRNTLIYRLLDSEYHT